MARLRNAPATQATATQKTTSTRQALKEKTNIAKGPVYSDDGNTEGLVKDAPKKRGRAKKGKQQEDEEEEYVMAGGLGPASEESPKQTSDAPMTTDELAKSSDATQPNPRANRRPARTVRKVVQSEAQSKVLDGLKQRMAATAKGQRAKQSTAHDSQAVSSGTVVTKPSASASAKVPAERSEFSISPSPPRPGKLSAVKRTSIAQPGSILKAQMTPAVESSMLALKHFKRRPRQPSMLQMVQQRLGSARPSLANATTLQVDDDAVDESSVFDLGLDDDEEEDDFAPEAEGTPLHVSKTKRRSTVGSSKQASVLQTKPHTESSSTTKKRKSDQLDVSSGSLGALRAKRQKPVADDVQDDQLEEDSVVVRSSQHADKRSSTREALPEGDEVVVRSSSRRTETPQPAVTSDVEVANSPSSSTPPTEPPSSRNQTTTKDIDEFVVPSTERDREADDGEADTQQHALADEDDASGLDGIMADPVSSSPAAEASRPDDDILAEPATQPSPSPAPVKAKPKKSKPMHTAALQSLLPKRRAPTRPRHRKSEYDFDEESESEADGVIDVSHLSADEDELGGRPRKSTSKSATAKNKKSTQTRAAKGKKTTKALATKSTASKGLKTYGRGAASDKENQDDDTFEEAEESTLPETSLSMQEAAKSAELEAAKRKFAEVDQWDIEFESMSAEAHRSSSPAWR